MRDSSKDSFVQESDNRLGWFKRVIWSRIRLHWPCYMLLVY